MVTFEVWAANGLATNDFSQTDNSTLKTTQLYFRPLLLFSYRQYHPNFWHYYHHCHQFITHS